MTRHSACLPGEAVEGIRICYRSEYRETSSTFKELLKITSEIRIPISPSNKPSSHAPANSFPQAFTKCWSVLKGSMLSIADKSKKAEEDPQWGTPGLPSARQKPPESWGPERRTGINHHTGLMQRMLTHLSLWWAQGSKMERELLSTKMPGAVMRHSIRKLKEKPVP